MPNVQIRNVPDTTHRVLRRRADDSGMSLQEYLLALLNETASRPTVAEVMARVARRSGGRIGLDVAADDVRAERSGR